ncbi:hypothetical protein NAB1_2785 [Lactiplantibacillus plantarum]|uniref:Uncharacterized protein n=1 Tax=Lactiplantibacillus plantarum WJL TaxID=1350466 RepID=A0A837P3Q8_LACPN|nr:hypothetical protein WJL_3246 [Lactiplantibacillus plantarum WJL]KZD96468.1 hypothetical protein FBR5_1585 [Lactiplantibacillus plantarum]KZU99291.1 hypothetical protein NAB1_2785 [Lactiplantibacillus plantarum]DAK54829.1 MAG TPA: hypothetical protein [Caudoviricetes sp.]
MVSLNVLPLIVQGGRVTKSTVSLGPMPIQGFLRYKGQYKL